MQSMQNHTFRTPSDVDSRVALGVSEALKPIWHPLFLRQCGLSRSLRRVGSWPRTPHGVIIGLN